MKQLFLLIILVMMLLMGFQENDLTPFQANDLWGYQDANGNIVIQPQYIFAEPFSKYGLALVASLEDGWKYIDSQGELVIKPYYIANDNKCDRFSDGLCRYEENGKIGYFDERGNIRIKAQFEYGSAFNYGYAAVAKGVSLEEIGELTLVRSNQWGFIDKNGQLVIPYQYESIIELFNEQGRAVVIKNGRQIIIDQKGNELGEQ